MNKKFIAILVSVFAVCGVMAMAGTAEAVGETVTLDIPTNVYRPAPFDVISTTINGGTAYTNVRFNITVSGPNPFTGSRIDIFTITALDGNSDTQGINDTFTLVGEDFVGYWGPGDGFQLPASYGATSTFTIQMTDTAQVGDYEVTVELVDLTPDPDDILASDTDDFSLSANALYIGTGQQFITIQSAIDAATDGDTINVTDGTYTITGAITVDEKVTIIGNTTNPENVLVKYNPANTDLNCIEVNSADVTIQGIKVTDCKNGFHFDRNVNTNTGVTISNCIIENVSGWGIGEIRSPNTTISHNTITNTGDKGIYFRLCEGDSESNRCEAISNVISGCGQSAIQTYFSKYAYIYDNTISFTNDKGINIIRSGATGETDRVQVMGNTISETKWPGIQIIGAPYTYVYDNTLTECNYYGGDGTGDWDYASIHVQDDIGSTYSYNTVIDSNTVSDGINGIQTWSDDVTITNNEIYNMGVTYADDKIVGGRIYKNSGILVGSNWGSGDIDPTGVVIEYNNIHDNYWGLFYNADLTNVVVAEYNWWGSHTGPSHSTNPFGTGDAVSDNVDYYPWLLVPVGSRAEILRVKGIPGKGIEIAPGLQKPFNPKSQAANNVGKKK